MSLFDPRCSIIPYHLRGCLIQAPPWWARPISHLPETPSSALFTVQTELPLWHSIQIHRGKAEGNYSATKTHLQLAVNRLKILRTDNSALQIVTKKNLEGPAGYSNSAITSIACQYLCALNIVTDRSNENSTNVNTSYNLYLNTS